MTGVTAVGLLPLLTSPKRSPKKRKPAELDVMTSPVAGAQPFKSHTESDTDKVPPSEPPVPRKAASTDGGLDTCNSVAVPSVTDWPVPGQAGAATPVVPAVV